MLKNVVWPSQSLYLNPTEFLWEELDRNVRSWCPSLQEDMWKALKENWNNISQDTINRFCSYVETSEKSNKMQEGFFDKRSV